MSPVVRKPSLEEWAFIHLHRRIWREGFFVPGTLEVDVSAILPRFAGAPPWTAIVAKAIALMASAHPVVNRMVFATLFGLRIVEFPRVGVSLPMLLTSGGGTRAKIETLFDAQGLSLAEIRAAVSRLRHKPEGRHNLLRFCATHRNRFWNRWLVRLLVFLYFNFPSLLVKGGGAGLGLSSLVSHGEPGFDLRGAGLSPCGLSFTLGALVRQPDGRVLLPIGVCYNHLACRGDEAYAAVRALWQILTGAGPGGYDELLR